MNRLSSSSLSRLFSTGLAIAVLGSGLGLPLVATAQDTQDKIRLMAGALRARNQGDLDSARRQLEELIRIAPEDPNVQRLLAAVNDEIARRPASAAGSAAPAPVSYVPPPTITPVSSASTPMVNAPVSRPAPSAAAEQAVAVAANQVERATDDARAAAREARTQARQGFYDLALDTLARAKAGLPDSPTTAATRADIDALAGDILLEQGAAALNGGQLAAARAVLVRYHSEYGADRQARRLEAALAAAEADPASVNLAEASPGFLEAQSAQRELIARGRAQFMAGDYDGAQESFGQVEARDPNNAEAKYFQTQIAQLRANRGYLDREKTRSQMLQEVAAGWQRPQVFDRESAARAAVQDSGLRARLESIVIPRVNFSGVPLTRVIDTLSELSEQSDSAGGVNIVLINPAGSDPTVNITLRNLSLNRILDFIVESVGYEYDVTNDAVVVRLGSGSGTRLETEFFPLSRSTIIRLTGLGAAAASASAAPANPFDPAPSPSAGAAGGEEKALRDFLQRAGVAFDSIPNANLALADGQLIVTNTPRNLERVRNILRRYNETKQVEIETKFLEVAQGTLDELGVNWLINNTRGGDQYGTMIDGDANSLRSLSGAFAPAQQAGRGQIIVAPTSITDPFTGAVTVNPGRELPVNVNAPAVPGLPSFAAGASNIANILGMVGRFEIEAIIRALSQAQGSDLMSAPKVTVLSGKTATITVAQELRYPESFGDLEAQVGSQGLTGGSGGAVAITAGTPQDFTVRNVGVEMTVTPTVEDDNSISLALEPKVTEFEGFVEYGGPSVAISGNTTVQIPSGFFQPIFSVRTVRTEVTIFDGATVVMGGLTREEVKTVKDKVPVLGDIPMLGRLFRSEGETSQKRNLLIFVTANLVSPGGSPAQQQFRVVDPGSLFQNPTIVTPGGSATRGATGDGR